ncbi:unnamed protein product [Parajaminaea phylloscopi]
MSAAAASLDKRRINGPERVHQPVFREANEGSGARRPRHAGQTLDKAGESSSARVGPSSSRQRADGREAEEMRPMYIQTGLIPQANGSSYIESGGLKLACAVYGPRQARATGGARQQFTDEAELNVECRYAPFATASRTKPGKSLESALLSSRIHSSLLPCIRLALLPKASLDVYITVLEADAPLEGVVAQAVTAASAALASAGVELWALCVGTVAALQESTPEGSSSASAPGSSSLLLVDPTKSEAANGTDSATSPSRPTLVSLVSMPALGSVVSLDVSAGSAATQGTEGSMGGGASGMDLETLDTAVATLTSSAAQVHKLVAEALQESLPAAL